VIQGRDCDVPLCLRYLKARKHGSYRARDGEHHTRNVDPKQLDEGIGNTFVLDQATVTRTADTGNPEVNCCNSLTTPARGSSHYSNPLRQHGHTPTYSGIFQLLVGQRCWQSASSAFYVPVTSPAVHEPSPCSSLMWRLSLLQATHGDASQRRFDVLLFWSLDRLSREGALETLQHLNRLTGYGIQWRSLTEQYLDSTGMFREAVISILAVVAKQERIHFQPCLEHAGLRRFRFHDMRHTFGSLLIQDGASLAYVRDQMGHSSIQVTVDTYGHLIPGANINWVDGLDRETSPEQNATQAQPELKSEKEPEAEPSEVILEPQDVGERGRNRTFNLLIKSQLLCQLSYAPFPLVCSTYGQ